VGISLFPFYLTAENAKNAEIKIIKSIIVVFSDIGIRVGKFGENCYSMEKYF